MWNVWFIIYGTYDEPNVEPRFIAGPMSFKKAWTMVEVRGFGYCMKPEELRRRA